MGDPAVRIHAGFDVDSNDETVTIVISAYMRVDSLNQTLKSVFAQTYKKWKVLIIGDHCDDEFVNSVDLSHPNVYLYNLPMRCGNQYGPNSVGLYFAETTYLAFLNHDDWWLTDHLELAVKTLKNESADFFIGKTANCYPYNQKYYSKKFGRLVFSDINHPEKMEYILNDSSWRIFEPASSWVIKTKTAKRIGYWRSPSEISTTPLMDWLQRAYAGDTKFCFSPKISCLKLELRNHTGYRDDSMNKFITHLHACTDERLREMINEDLANIHGRVLAHPNSYFESNDEGKSIRNTYGWLMDFLRIYHVFIPVKAFKKIINKLIGIIRHRDSQENKLDFTQVLKNRTGERFASFMSTELIIEQVSSFEGGDA